MGSQGLKYVVNMNTFLIHGVMSIAIALLLPNYHLINIEEAVKLSVLICSRNMLQNSRGEKGVS